MERVNFTGTYKGADNIRARRCSVSTTARGATSASPRRCAWAPSTTYIMTGRSGENRFRVYDPKAKKGSNVILVTID